MRKETKDRLKAAGRKVGREAWEIAKPILIGIAITVGSAYLDSRKDDDDDWDHWDHLRDGDNFV